MACLFHDQAVEAANDVEMSKSKLFQSGNLLFLAYLGSRLQSLI